ncbi:MAG: stage III sporulation protein AD [Firmicutes bacterium]|nr:stage III sporulation protein AD [Bacillota bacterium]MBQ6948429.1 stage III sporulation protein AD [Bacillota bacterium]
MEKSMLTISAFGMMGMCLSLILRQYNKEMAMMISIVSSILMMLFLLDHIRSFLEMIASYLNRIQGGNLYISILIKILLTAYTADLTAQLCRDAGETSIASKIELAGKIIICLIASPVIVSVLETISGLLLT